MSGRFTLSNYSFVCVIVVTATILVTAAGTIQTCKAEHIAKGDSRSQESKPVSRSGTGGLALLYPGDEAIERDPRVLYVEDVEMSSPEEIVPSRSALPNEE